MWSPLCSTGTGARHARWALCTPRAVRSCDRATMLRASLTKRTRPPALDRHALSVTGMATMRLLLTGLAFLFAGNVAAAGVADLSNADAASGLKQALSDGS